MCKTFNKYTIPPKYNFLKYDSVKPFVMYFFEFEQELSREDLSHIWQGVSPSSSLRGSEKLEKQVYEHETGENEFFEGGEIPSDIRWMFFKVKQKAEKDYDKYKIEQSSKDEYGYNWPYDYCSIVEVAKVEASVEITPIGTSEKLKLGKVLKGD